MALTLDDFEIINDFIGKNDNWGLINNCSYFASGLWNSVSEAKLNSFGAIANHPYILAESIMNQSGYETGRYFNISSEVGYNSYGRYRTTGVYGITDSQSTSNAFGSSSSSGSLSSGSSSHSSTPLSSRSSIPLHSGSSKGSSVSKR